MATSSQWLVGLYYLLIANWCSGLQLRYALPLYKQLRIVTYLYLQPVPVLTMLFPCEADHLRNVFTTVLWLKIAASALPRWSLCTIKRVVLLRNNYYFVFAKILYVIAHYDVRFVRNSSKESGYIERQNGAVIVLLCR